MERSASRHSTRPPSRASQARTRPPSSQIRVVARFRPLEDDSAPSCIEELTHQSVLVSGLSQQFNFDRVFGPDTRQQEVFDEAAKPTVEGVLAGYNGCVLAYGQTGAGKSHTMMGGAGEDRGVIPRMIEYLFANKPKTTRRVEVGYLEIYNEKVRDLLGSASTPNDDLRVHEVSGGGGFYVKGLTHIAVESAAEVYAAMRRGERNRSTAATNMNAQSSRGHSVFLVDVFGPQTQSKLVLVDLAGSEKVAKTGARGALLEEAANINRSLTSLGMVVNALAASDAAQSQSPQSPQDETQEANQNGPPPPPLNGGGTPHIPFRDSKLTRILQDSLSGNSRTCLVVHCSPSMRHLSETVSTLRFGVRAKHVKTAPRINYTPSVATDGAQVAAMTAAIDKLQTEKTGMLRELVDAHRSLNQVLMAEQSRLAAQKAADLEVYSAKSQHIEGLRQRIADLEHSTQLDEFFVFAEIGRLGPRVYD